MQKIEREKIRIGIAGAQGVGKTTLSLALKDTLGLPLIEEQARKIARNMNIKGEWDLRSQDNWQKGIEFQQKVLDAQIKAEAEHQSFVSDRTTIDNAVYWLLWDHAKASPDERKAYIEAAKQNALSSYTMVIYVPIEFSVADDGFRTIDPTYQQEVDGWIQTLIKGWGVPNVVAVSGSVQKRLKQILRILGREICLK